MCAPRVALLVRYPFAWSSLGFATALPSRLRVVLVWDDRALYCLKSALAV